MRILMTADAVGGVWTYALDLARHFASRDIHTSLATMGRPLSDSQWMQAGEISSLTIHESEFRLEWMQTPWEDVQAASAWLLDIERRVRPDVIHLNSYAHGDLPWQAPVMVVAHSCVFSWWEAVRGGPPPSSYDRYKAAVRTGLLSADFVVAPSRFMLGQLTRFYGADHNAEVIYNGTNPSRFKVGKKEPVVLTVGRLWDEAKNVQAALAAAPEFRWPLLLAGDTRHPDGWSVDLSQVRHLGTLPPDALARWYSAASIYLFPARYEPFGLSVLEAALSGCALVLGDIPSFRELWDGAAIFVSPENPKAIVEAINLLTENPDLLREMGERARTAALPFTLDRCADAYLRCYERISRGAAANHAS